MVKKDTELYHYCLVEYKKYLRDRFKKKNKEKESLKKKIDQVMKIEDEFFGGGLKNEMKKIKHLGIKKFQSKKKRGQKLERCVFNYAKALEQEEKELKERLKHIRIERISLKRNLKQIIDEN